MVSFFFLFVASRTRKEQGNNRSKRFEDGSEEKSRKTVLRECLLIRVPQQIGLMEPKYRPGQEINKEGTAA
jgi:hypothetical protein